MTKENLAYAKVSMKDRAVSALWTGAGALTVPTAVRELASRSFEKLANVRADFGLDLQTRVIPEALQIADRLADRSNFKDTLETLNFSVDKLLEHPVAHASQVLGTAILVADAFVGARKKAPETVGKQILSNVNRFAAGLTVNVAPALVTEIPQAIDHLIKGQEIASSILEVGVVAAGSIYIVNAIANIRNAQVESSTHREKSKITDKNVLTTKKIPKPISNLRQPVIKSLNANREAAVVVTKQIVTETEKDIAERNKSYTNRESRRTTLQAWLHKIHGTKETPMPSTTIPYAADAIKNLAEERLQDHLKIAGKEIPNDIPEFLKK